MHYVLFFFVQSEGTFVSLSKFRFMISSSTIDKVFEATRIEEVIGDFVVLKRAGSNLKGLSPFSQEKSPSFMVSPVKQIWKDFSSSKGGNAITFLMEHEHFTYPEAIRYLARKYSIEIEETEQSSEEQEASNEKESMYLVSEYANTYFQNILWRDENGRAIAHSYFKERGFTDDTIKKFGLGYSPDAWDAFTNEALGKGYKLDFLDKTGLTIVKEDKKFDRFKGRVMFPILSMSGRVLGFGGRILTNDKKAAKYLNSPETPIYHKSKVLYGIFQAKQSIAKEDNCYLVEGYTDVIQFSQSGIENVVASSGTALTPDQIRLINRLTKNITVLYDGDAAGLRASIRGIDLILEEGMNVRVCTFPDGEDPDSFAKKSSFEDLKHYLENNTQDFIQFKASLLMKEAKNDPIKKAELIHDMVVSISKIPEMIKREVYVQECARIMDISEQVIYSTLAQLGKKEIAKADKEFKKEQQQKVFEVVKPETQEDQAQVKEAILYEFERKIIEILLLYGNAVEEFQDEVITTNEDGEVITKTELFHYKIFHKIYMCLHEDEIDFANDSFKEIYADLIHYYFNNETFEIEKFLMSLSIEKAQMVSSILMDDEIYVMHKWDEQDIVVKQKDQSIAQYTMETIMSLRWYWVDKKIDNLKNSLSNDPAVDNFELLTDVRDYNNLKIQFSGKLGRVMSRYSV